MESICGIDCNKCELNKACRGCVNTFGHPFDGNCLIAECSKDLNCSRCMDCKDRCILKSSLLKEIKELNIDCLLDLKDLNAVKGSFMNVEYLLEDNSKKKYLNDNDIYFANQIQLNDKFYGVCCNKDFILVSVYDLDYSNPKVLLYKERN